MKRNQNNGKPNKTTTPTKRKLSNQSNTPNKRFKYQDYFKQGLGEFKSEEYENAIQSFTQAIALNNKKADAYSYRGIANGYLGQYQEAIADHTQAIQLDKKDHVSYNNRGEARINLGQYQEALKDLNKAIDINKKFAPAYYNRANAKVKLERYEEAIEDYNKAIKLDENYVDAYINRGNAKVKLERYAETIDDNTKAIQLDCEQPLAYSVRGDAYYNLKNYEKAIRDYDKAISLDDKNAVHYFDRGKSYYQLNHYEKALIDLDNAISLNKEYVDAYVTRGFIKAKLEHYHEAIEDYSIALQLNDGDADLYNKRGDAKAELEEYDEAIKDYTQAIQMDNKYSCGYYNRGIAYLKKAEFEAAIDDFNQALSLNFRNNEVLQALNKAKLMLESVNSVADDGHIKQRSTESSGSQMDSLETKELEYSTTSRYQPKKPLTKTTDRNLRKKVNTSHSNGTGIFTADVQPEDLNFKQVPLKTAKPTSNKAKEPQSSRILSPNNKKKQKTTEGTPEIILSEDDKYKIGRWGEKLVFLKLKDHYQAKYSTYTFKDTDTGFKLSKDKSAVKLKWHNYGMPQDEDSGAHIDMEVIKKNTQGEKCRHKYVEVKATRSDTKNVANFSGAELSLMRECKDEQKASINKYRLFRVYNTGTAQARIEKIKNPYKQIEKEDIAVTAIQVRI
jgi:tetratricopeptide (TPR) repeat protein